MEGALMYLDENGDPIENPEYLNDYGELPGDPRARIPPEVMPAESPTSGGVPWYEALFPKSSANADAPAYSPRALDAAWRDISSAPGRAYASLTRPEGESYLDAMARTEAQEGAEGAWRVTDNLLRDPLLAPSLAAPALRIPAWLAAAAPRWVRAAAAGVELGANVGSRPMQAARAAAKATPGGAAIAGLSQSERLARGEAPNVGQALGTFAAAPVLAGAGPLVEGAGGAMKRGGVQALRQMVKPTTTELDGFYKAMDAGLLPEAAGAFTMTPGGAGERYIGRMKMRTEAAYAPAVAEAERTGATVNMNRAMGEANDFLRSEADAGRIALGEQDIRNTGEWLGEKLLYRDAPGRAALADAIKRRTIIPAVERPVVQAHRLKSAMQEVAYPGKDPRAIAPASGMTTAAKGADRAIRAQIAEVSPAYAAADAQVAPWYAGADAFQRAADVRGGNYALDIMAPLIGGAAGSQGGVASGLGGALGTAALVRYLRSPALARHLWEAGRATQAVGRGLQARPSLGSMLMQSQTDNAR
jgi:hypothetical protein